MLSTHVLPDSKRSTCQCPASSAHFLRGKELQIPGPRLLTPKRKLRKAHRVSKAVAGIGTCAWEERRYNVTRFRNGYGNRVGNSGGVADQAMPRTVVSVSAKSGDGRKGGQARTLADKRRCNMGRHIDPFSALFKPSPEQWGLRGDPFLWRAMARALTSCTFPSTEAQLVALLETTFERFTGSRLPEESAISEDDSIFVKRYARGGMSSGQISLKFWRGSALPLLRSRYIIVRQSSPTLPS